MATGSRSAGTNFGARCRTCSRMPRNCRFPVPLDTSSAPRVGHRLSRRFSGSPRGHKPFSTSRSENGPKSKNNGSSSSLCWTSKTEHQSSQKAASVCSSRLGLRGADIRPGPGFRVLDPHRRNSPDKSKSSGDDETECRTRHSVSARKFLRRFY
jgi:hypothetical protein